MNYITWWHRNKSIGNDVVIVVLTTDAKWPARRCVYMYHWSHDRMTYRRFALRIQMYIIAFLCKSSISHLRRWIVGGCWRLLLLLLVLIRCCAVAFISWADLVTLAISNPHAENEGWEKQDQQGQVPQVRTRPIRGFIICNATYRQN